MIAGTTGGAPGATLDLGFMYGVLDPSLTFTRGSAATYFDATGVMQTAGLNLVTNSGSLSSFTVTFSSVAVAGIVLPDGTTGGTQLIENSANNEHGEDFTFVGAASTTYTASIYAKANTRTRVDIGLRGGTYWVSGNVIAVADLVAGTVLVTVGTGAAAIQAVGNGWYRVSVTATTAASPTGACYTRHGMADNTNNHGYQGDGVSSVYFWGAQVEVGSTPTLYAPTAAATSGAPRFDNDPVTHAALGLLIEEQRINVVLNSGDVSNASWAKTAGGTGATIPVVTANQSVAPDGTLTAARVAFSAAGVSGAFSTVSPGSPTVTVNPYAWSVWLKGSVGGEQLYLSATPNGALYYNLPVTLTTAWQRFSLNTPNLTAVPWFFLVGIDMRDATQTAKPAQTVFVWGGQVEQGAFPTSYIPTTGAAVTRSGDQCRIQPAQMGFYTPPGGSWMAEFINQVPSPPASLRILAAPNSQGGAGVMYLNTGLLLSQYDGVAVASAVGASVVNSVSKGATTMGTGQLKSVLNGGAVNTVAAAATGYPTLGTTGLALLTPDASAENMTGYIRRVRYWPRVLSNAELQSVTT